MKKNIGEIKFTPSQARATAHRAGEMVVLASAGSGKTSSLTQRCVELLLDPVNRCAVDQLLVVTFTNEAAGEMRSRIHRAMRDQAGRITDPDARQYARRQAALMESASIMTLHAFCYAFLKSNFAVCGINPSVRLLDEIEARLLLRDAVIDTLRNYGADRSGRHAAFFDFYKFSCNARPDLLIQTLSPLLAQLDNSPDPNHYVTLLRQHLADPHASHVALATVLRDKIMAYVDLLQYAIERLARYKFAGKMIQNLQTLSNHAIAIPIHAKLEQSGASIDDMIEAAPIPKLEMIRRPKSVDPAEFDHVKESEYKTVAAETKTFFKDQLPSILKSHNALWQQTETQYLHGIIDFILSVRCRLGAIKAARHVLDFSDLEHRTFDALQNASNGLLSDVRSHYRHILVDEYQDINPVQEELISLLSSHPLPGSPAERSRFMVGDVLQSIYGFRGAVPELLYGHYRQIQATKPNDVVEMRENFRTAADLLTRINTLLEPVLGVVDEIVQPTRSPADSTPCVLATNASGVAAQSQDDSGPPPLAIDHPSILLSKLPLPLPARQSPPLTSTVDGPYRLMLTIVERITRPADGGEGLPQANVGDNGSDSESDSDSSDADAPSVSATVAEASVVAENINQLVQRGRIALSDGESRPVEYSDIVILTRSLRTVAPIYVRELARAGIPAKAQLASGFLDSQCVLETISLLRVLDNPQQDIDAASALVGMYGCVQIHELAALRLAASDRHASLPQILAGIADGRMKPDDEHLTADLVNRIKAHMQRLDSWRRTVTNRGIADGLAQIFEQAAIRPLLNGRPDGQLQLANLELLLSRAKRFAEDASQGVGRFLEFIELLSENDEDLSAAGVEAVDCVRIMSIHASKGLEFPVVLLVGLGKTLNQRSSNTDLLCGRDGQIALCWVDAAECKRVKSTRHWAIGQQIKLITLQEEARLLYVAMTRARDHLLLFGTASAQAIARYRRRAGDTIQNRARQCGISNSLAMLDLIAPVMMDESLQSSLNVTIIPAPATSTFNAAPAAHSNGPTPATITSHDAISPDSPVLEDVWNRIKFHYPYTTDIPAVVSVSRLKKDQLSAGRSPLTAAVDSASAADIQTSIDRGLAVHTFMQMVDFASLAVARASAEPHVAIGKLIDALIQRGCLGADTGRLIEVDQILWFSQTELFNRVVQAAHHDAVRREMPMMWTMPASEVAEKLGISTWARSGENVQSGHIVTPNRDAVMVRGIIDLLLYNPGQTPGQTAGPPIIIDYKTDQPQHIKNRLAAYREQIHLYATAVGRLLGTPQVEGYLVFLTAREIHHCNSAQ